MERISCWKLHVSKSNCRQLKDIQRNKTDKGD